VFLDSLAKTIKLKKSNMEMQQKMQKSTNFGPPKQEDKVASGFELIHVAGAFLLAFIIGMWYGS
jgi:hypothetical protein